MVIPFTQLSQLSTVSTTSTVSTVSTVLNLSIDLSCPKLNKNVRGLHLRWHYFRKRYALNISQLNTRNEKNKSKIVRSRSTPKFRLLCWIKIQISRVIMMAKTTLSFGDEYCHLIMKKQLVSLACVLSANIWHSAEWWRIHWPLPCPLF